MKNYMYLHVMCCARAWLTVSSTSDLFSERLRSRRSHQDFSVSGFRDRRRLTPRHSSGRSAYAGSRFSTGVWAR
jgi:hypothetical protein